MELVTILTQLKLIHIDIHIVETKIQQMETFYIEYREMKLTYQIHILESDKNTKLVPNNYQTIYTSILTF
jgi:hypothetical protein